MLKILLNNQKMKIKSKKKIEKKNTYRVIFFCNWKENSAFSLLEELKMLTPNCSGIFNNLIGTSNFDEADIVIFLEGIPKNFYLNLSQKVVICYPREPFFHMRKNWEQYNLKYGFTYDSKFHVLADPKFLNKYHDFLTKLKYENKSKKLSMIVSGKGNNKFHLKRRNFAIELSNYFKNRCDIFGSKWNGELNSKAYKGELGFYHNDKNKNSSKYEGLIDYQYSICIENVNRKNYFSEKFTDSILTNTIPIYSGCPNIGEYFPPNCYYLIDINSPHVFSDIEEIIKNPITELQINDLKIARDLILNRYNIWGDINELIND